MTHILERAGLRLAYDDTGVRGDRPTAVLIHGWLSKRADLRRLGAALAPTYRVIALDVPGHGESDVPGVEDAADRLAVPAQAADVAALCDRLGIRDAVLIGHSAGVLGALHGQACRGVRGDPGDRAGVHVRGHAPLPRRGRRHTRAPRGA